MDAIDPKSAALVIQDLQNDVIIEGGAFADSGAPAHATSQNVVANVGEKLTLPVVAIFPDNVVEAPANTSEPALTVVGPV